LYSHALPRDASVCSALLIAAVLTHKVASTVNLETAEYVLRPSDTTVVGRISLITDVNVTTSSRTSGTTLRRSASGSITASAASTAVSRASLAALAV